VKHQIRNNWC